QAFIADRTQAQYELRRKAVTLQAQQRSWKELLAELRSDAVAGKPLDEPTQADIVKQVRAAADQANAKWAALSRIEAEFAANRTGRTAEIYALYNTQRDVIWSDPILNWTVISAAASALLAFFLGFWILRAAVLLVRAAHAHQPV